ncbi:MAG: hypothetical protein P4L83_22220 [Nevskia sp.]|nr:hypothetical protein [Nevskia sp.]
MLRLPPAGAPAPPEHWWHAPLPDAVLLLARPDALLTVAGQAPVAAAGELLAALGRPAAPGATLVALDAADGCCRLRHAGAAADGQLWQMQSLAESRARLLTRLRALLAERMAERVLHELRGPLNAMLLHADLVGRLLPAAASGQAERIAASTDIIRQRSRDLRARLDASAALWLGAEEDAAEPVTLGQILDDSLRLLNGQLSLQELRLRAEGLHLVGGRRLAGSATPVRLALIALLLCAAAGTLGRNGGAGPAEITLSATAGDGHAAALELRAPLDGAALGHELAGTDTGGLLATLALLLEPAGLGLHFGDGAGLTRLSLPPE